MDQFVAIASPLQNTKKKKKNNEITQDMIYLFERSMLEENKISKSKFLTKRVCKVS
jgi:hypothetical protein